MTSDMEKQKEIFYQDYNEQIKHTVKGVSLKSKYNESVPIAITF